MLVVTRCVQIFRPHNICFTATEAQFPYLLRSVHIFQRSPSVVVFNYSSLNLIKEMYFSPRTVQTVHINIFWQLGHVMMYVPENKHGKNILNSESR
jgi:hypothetical protein